MNKIKLKKIISFILIFTGAVLLVIEIASSSKNYYLQTMGIISLMTGVFLVNTSLSSRSTGAQLESLKNVEEEEIEK